MGQLADRIDGMQTIDGAARAVEFERRWMYWGDIATARARIAQELERADLGNESRIGLMMRNDSAMVPAIYEVIGSRCLVTLNPMLNTDKLGADVAATMVPAVIGVARDLDSEAVHHALVEAGCLVLEMTGDRADPVRVRQRRSSANWSKARSFAPGVALEMLTSGTTGAPKRIPMRRDAFEMAVFGTARFEKGRAQDDSPKLRSGVQLLMAPLSHVSGLLALMNATVAGRAVTLLERFRVEDFRDVVSRHKIKAASIPPAALKMLYDAGVEKEELASLQAFRVGTAPLDPDLADAVYERYGIPVLQNYGATEFGGVAGWTLDDFNAHRVSRRGAVGRLNPGISGRIVHPETGIELAPGETGVLQLKSRQIGDGENWTPTTDLAKLDAENFLWILGRADNAIIRGGFKVHPDEVVRALESHPAVVEAAVVGLKDERLGQVPGAAYTLAKGASDPGGEELASYLKQRLTSYQVPVVLKALDDLPRTVSLKADLTAVKALLEPLHEAAR
jgi:acyl-coenzyme A synthetase/AMP-(fatty) acid ligase